MRVLGGASPLWIDADGNPGDGKWQRSWLYYTPRPSWVAPARCSATSSRAGARPAPGERSMTGPSTASASSTWYEIGGPLLRRPPRRDGSRRDQDRAAGLRRHDAIARTVRRRRRGRGRRGYSLFWSVEGRAGAASPWISARPMDRPSSASSPRSPTWSARTFAPAPWSVGTSDPTTSTRLVVVRISVFGQDGPYQERGGLDRLGIAYGGLLS